MGQVPRLLKPRGFEIYLLFSAREQRTGTAFIIHINQFFESPPGSIAELCLAVQAPELCGCPVEQLSVQRNLVRAKRDTAFLASWFFHGILPDFP